MKPRNLLPLQLFAACLIGLLLGKFCFSTTKEKVELSLFNGKLSKLQSIINIIDNKYVDHVNIDSLNELVIPDMLARLDPHTSYVPAKRINESEKKIVGYFYGIGIEHYTFDDTVTVVCIIPGSPATKADIMPGDKIISVDSTDVTGHTSKDKLSAAMRGERDTEARLRLIRQGSDSILTTTIRRGSVPVPSTAASYIIDSTTAYIKLDNFGDNSYIEFAKDVLRLKNDGATKIIIDLRENLGGRLEQARLIAREILAQGDTITYTIGRENKTEDLYINSIDNGICQDMSVVCIVNSHTASAAEILSAAIQDNDRGVIVGRRTFGKGLVQSPIQMQDGSLIRLTTARYYMPSGRSLQKSYKNYDNDLPTRFKKGELDSASAFTPADTTKYFTKNGRVVYSKCGVMPDVFVPIDNTPLPHLAYKLDSALVTIRFALYKYNSLGHKDPQQYIHALFDDEERTYDELIAYAMRHGIDIDPRKQKKAIAESFHAAMTSLKIDAYHVSGDENTSIFYYNCDDPDIKAANDILNDEDRYQQILNEKPSTTTQDNGKTTIIRDKDRN